MSGETDSVPEPAAEADRIDVLASTIEGLMSAITTLTATFETNSALTAENTEYLQRKIAALDRADRRRKRSIRWAFATIAADLMVTSVGAFIWYTQAETNRKVQASLKATYVTQQQQAQTRTRVLCPLYTVLLAASDDPARIATLTPARKAQFEANVQVIRDGYTTLGCKPDLPATH